MNTKVQLSQTDFLKNSVFSELLENLLLPDTDKLWLQKVANLLKQFTGAKNLILNIFTDNSIICISEDPSDKKFHHRYAEVVNAEQSFWVAENYVVPLELEGYLEVSWTKLPSKYELDVYNIVFSYLTSALKNRANLITQKLILSKDESLSKFEYILNTESDFKTKINSFAKEIALFLDISRCQIKFFSGSLSFVFDGTLSAEFVKDGYLESLSVISSIEDEWLQKIKNNQVLILNHNSVLLQGSLPSDIEALLSIKSILGYPLIYEGKPLGVIVLHQCDYERIWKTEEIQYLRETAVLLSVLAGKEFELNEKLHSRQSLIDSFVINSDEFLKELNHLQIESRINNSPFSLIMIDIEKLREINFNMGFVAGNLVLAQVARLLNRLFKGTFKVARYNNDEFVVIMKNTDHSKAQTETEKLKDQLYDFIVLGVGPVEFNFSFVTYPVHSESIQELLGFLEQAMILSKSRGKFQISSIEEIQGQPKERWQQLVLQAIPEIIFKKTNFKTGPELIETINKQIIEQKKKQAYSTDILDSIQSLAIALDAKDSCTGRHSNRVSEYAYILAKKVSLDLQEVEWVRLAAVMHDIGKIGIPESILCKQGKLTRDEYEVMKKHPIIGAKILKPIKPLEKVATLVLYHHEYWNGAGYPQGLSKEDIPIGARIVSIVDAYQAMISNRPYRPALPFEEVINKLRAGKEKQWEPDLIELFIKIVS